MDSETQASPKDPSIQNPQAQNPIQDSSSQVKGRFSKKLVIISVIIISLLLTSSTAGFYVFTIKNNSSQEKGACTLEAKLCPDGSSVGRQGANCEFTPCPTAAADSQPYLVNGTVKKNGYELTLTNGYYLNVDSKNNYDLFSELADNSRGKSFVVYREKTTTEDPCALNIDPETYPDSSCVIINGYKALDWGTNIPSFPMGPLTNTYSLINEETIYKITFLEFVNQTEKDNILSTLKFTD